MTDNTEPLPSEAAVAEVLRRCNCDALAARVFNFPDAYSTTILAARLVEKYEPETFVDPDVLAADEYLARAYEEGGFFNSTARARTGKLRGTSDHKAIVAAIKGTREKCRG